VVLQGACAAGAGLQGACAVGTMPKPAPLMWQHRALTVDYNPCRCKLNNWHFVTQSQRSLTGVVHNVVAVGGFRGWKGRGPSAEDSTPPGAAPTYPHPGQQGNGLSESQGDQIWSGAGFFPCGFPHPPTTCLNFSLWRNLSVWRIRGGHFGRGRSRCGGVYRQWGGRPHRRFMKPTVLWTTIPPWAFL